MTRNTYFRRLFNRYVGSGFVVCAFCLSFGLLIGSLSYSDDVDYAKDKRALYAALQGENVEEKAKEAAETIRKMIEGKPLPEYIDGLRKLENSSHYWKVFAEKSSNLIALAKGDRRDLAASVNVPKWGTFWKWFAILSWLLLSVCTTFNLVCKSIEYHEGLLDWPWRDWWTYPVIIAMSPCLLPCMGIEALFRVGGGITRRDQHETQQQTLPEARQAQAHPDLPPADTSFPERIYLPSVEYLANMEKARTLIEAAKAKSDKQREKWEGLFDIGLFDRKISKLNGNVYQYQSVLSDLGERITSAQRDLAESKAQLAQWQEGAEALKAKKREEWLKDLDRLLALPHVVAVDIEGKVLHVYTDIILIEYESRRFEIGIFAISIYTETNQISLKNLCSTHPQGRCHPYSSGDELCWGSMHNPIYNALAEREYPVALHYILRALQSAEGDNPSGVKYWKEATE